MRRNHPVRNIILFSLIGSFLIGVLAPPLSSYAKTTNGGGGASTKYDKLSPTDKAKSYLAYNYITWCISNRVLGTLFNGYGTGNINKDRITVGEAESGNWFYSQPGDKPPINYFLGDKANSGQLDCGDPAGIALIKDAFTRLWGYTSMAQALCDSGAQRWDYRDPADCVNSGGDFTGSQNTTTLGTTNHLDNNEFHAAIISKVYGGTDPNSWRQTGVVSEKAAEYVQDRNSFFTACLGTGNPSPYTGSHTEATDRMVYIIKYVNDQGVEHDTTYYGGTAGGYNKDANLTYYGTNGNVSTTCGHLADMVNTNAANYASITKTTPDKVAPTAAGGSSAPTCGDVVSNVGWILCPIITGVAGFNDYAWNIVSGMLNVNPLNQSDPIYAAWGTIRSLANIIFVIFFLIVIFSQLTGAGISNYGVKKLLPRLIVCAILVNISFVIVQVTVDLFNIIGSGLYQMIVGMAPAIQLRGMWMDLIGTIAGGVGTVAVGGTAIALAGGVGSAFWLLLPMVLMAMLALLTAILTLIFRQAVIPILAIIAPLAFVAYLLPNTEQWFKKWKDLLLPMLMLYPLAALVFGGAQFAASIIISQGGWWNLIVGLIVMAMPLFSLPFLARQGGSVLSTVGGQLSKMAEKARNPLTGYGKERSDASKAKYQADDRPEAKSAFGRFGRRIAPRGLSRSLAASKQKREWATEGNKEAFKAQVASNNVKRLGGASVNGKGAFDRLTAAKQNMGIEQQKSETRVKNDNPIINQGHGGTHLNEKKYGAGLANETAENANTKRLQENHGYDRARAITEVSKTQANTATKEAEDRTENSAGMLQVRVDDAHAEADLDNSKKATEAVIEEAKSGATPEEGSALASLTPASRTGLADAKLQGGRTASRIQSAQRVQAKAYEKDIAQSYSVGGYTDAAGKPLKYRETDAAGNRIEASWAGTDIPLGAEEIPVTASAIEAAGVDNDDGEATRVRALASQASDKRQSDEVAARRILIEATTDVSGKIPAAEAALIKALAANDVVGARAATAILTTTGAPGKMRLQDVIMKEIPAGSTTEAVVGVKADLLLSGIKNSSASLDKWATDKNNRQLSDLVLSQSTYSGLNPEELAGQTNPVLRAAFEIGSIEQSDAEAVLGNEQASRKLSAGQRKFFEKIAAGEEPDYDEENSDIP